MTTTTPDLTAQVEQLREIATHGVAFHAASSVARTALPFIGGPDAELQCADIAAAALALVQP